MKTSVEELHYQTELQRRARRYAVDMRPQAAVANHGGVLGQESWNLPAGAGSDEFMASAVYRAQQEQALPDVG